MTIILIVSCEEESKERSGKVTFSLSQKTSLGGWVAQEAKKVLVSIADGNGVLIHNKTELELYDFNGDMLTAPIDLVAGNFYLSEYLVVNADNEVVYASPIEGSALAYLVADPLPNTFSITTETVTKVAPEVVKTEAYTASQFGYVTFSFNVVNTLDFLTAVFVYDTLSQSFVLTSHTLQVKSGSETLFVGDQGSATNRIGVRENATTYEVIVAKPGYVTYSQSFTAEGLRAYESVPLIVTLLSGAGTSDASLNMGMEFGTPACYKLCAADMPTGAYADISVVSAIKSGVMLGSSSCAGTGGCEIGQTAYAITYLSPNSPVGLRLFDPVSNRIKSAYVFTASGPSAPHDTNCSGNYTSCSGPTPISWTTPAYMNADGTMNKPIIAIRLKGTNIKVSWVYIAGPPPTYVNPSLAYTIEWPTDEFASVEGSRNITPNTRWHDFTLIRKLDPSFSNPAVAYKFRVRLSSAGPSSDGSSDCYTPVPPGIGPW
jgi:hypothetical protein